MKDLEILLADGNSKKEAERRIENHSYTIYEAATFENEYMEDWITETDPDDRAEEIEKFRKMIKEGVPTVTDWSVCDCDETRYLIAYEN